MATLRQSTVDFRKINLSKAFLCQISVWEELRLNSANFHRVPEDSIVFLVQLRLFQTLLEGNILISENFPRRFVKKRCRVVIADPPAAPSEGDEGKEATNKDTHRIGAHLGAQKRSFLQTNQPARWWTQLRRVKSLLKAWENFLLLFFLPFYFLVLSAFWFFSSQAPMWPKHNHFRPSQ